MLKRQIMVSEELWEELMLEKIEKRLPSMEAVIKERANSNEAQ